MMLGKQVDGSPCIITCVEISGELKSHRKTEEAKTMKHIPFIGRTVIVKNGKVDEAFRVLNKIMGSEGHFDIFRRNMYYEKPFNTRRRYNYEKCKAIYDEDMSRKIIFLTRKNRVDPWPGR